MCARMIQCLIFAVFIVIIFYSLFGFIISFCLYYYSKCIMCTYGTYISRTRGHLLFLMVDLVWFGSVWVALFIALSHSPSPSHLSVFYIDTTSYCDHSQLPLIKFCLPLFLIFFEINTNKKKDQNWFWLFFFFNIQL